MLVLNKYKNKGNRKAGASDHIIRHHRVLPSKGRRKQTKSIKTVVNAGQSSPWRVIQGLSRKGLPNNFQEAHH